MAYIGSSPTKVVSRQSANIFTYQATANQTAFTGSDANGNTLACTPSDIMVHMNGIKLEESDYTASTTTVTLGSGAAAGDEVTITAFVTFETADAYTKSASDTRYVNTTGDTMSGNLTTTGNVGVGETSPNLGSSGTGLHIKGAASKDGVIKLDSQTANRSGIVQFTENGTDKWRIGYDATSNHLEFTRSGVADRMLISDDGYVTTPSQPFFDAYMSANYTTGSSGVYNISTSASWGAHVNTGSHFNASNGTFTAPIAGRYLFYAGLGVQSYPTSAYLSCEFEVNGSRKYIHWFSNYGTSYAAANNTTVINLNASDYVRLVSETHQSATYIGTGSGIYNHFGGYLLG